MAAMTCVDMNRYTAAPVQCHHMYHLLTSVCFCFCLFEILFRNNEEVQDFSRYVLTALCFDVLVDWSPGLSLEFLRLCNIVVASCAGSEVC